MNDKEAKKMGKIDIWPAGRLRIISRIINSSSNFIWVKTNKVRKKKIERNPAGVKKS